PPRRIRAGPGWSGPGLRRPGQATVLVWTRSPASLGGPTHASHLLLVILRQVIFEKTTCNQHPTLSIHIRKNKGPHPRGLRGAALAARRLQGCLRGCGDDAGESVQSPCPGRERTAAPRGRTR